MAKEIERKYLIDLSLLDSLGEGKRIKQGYLPVEGKTVARARVKGNKAFLTLKGESNGLSCSEFEYEIPVVDAEQIIDELCLGGIVDKTRYEIPFGGHTWEIDIFHGDNDGLVIAEVELSNESENIELPSWITEEVTGQVKYFNSQLLKKPYSNW